MQCEICGYKFSKLVNNYCYLCDKLILHNIELSDNSDYIVVKSKLLQKEIIQKIYQTILDNIKNSDDITINVKDIDTNMKIINMTMIEYHHINRINNKILDKLHYKLIPVKSDFSDLNIDGIIGDTSEYSITFNINIKHISKHNEEKHNRLLNNIVSNPSLKFVFGVNNIVSIISKIN